MRTIVRVAGTMVLIGSLAACGGTSSSTGTGSEGGCGKRSVVVTTGADGSIVFPALPADEAGLASAVADMFCAEFSISFPDGYVTPPKPAPLNKKDAACIGGELVDKLGVERVRQLGLGNSAWSLIGFGLGNVSGVEGVTREEAETITSVFTGCTSAWKMLLIRSVTEGTDEISDRAARCVRDRIADRTAKSILIGELDRAYDDRRQPDATPYPELIEPLVKVFDSCLDDDERDLVDWN